MVMREGRFAALVDRARRLGARWVFVGASALMVLLALYTVWLALHMDLHAAQVARLSIVWAVVGITWATTGIVSNILSIRSAAGRPSTSRRELLEPRLTRSDPFVDRARETTEILQAIVAHQVTNIHGRKGSGKSHFLSFINDVANGHRKAGDRETLFRHLAEYQVAYFDLSEALGFDDVVRLLFQANFPNQAGSWEQFTKNIEALFGFRPVVLILDNANSEALWRQLGKALYHYLTRRPFDRIVIGSIRPVRFYNLQVQGYAFEGFDDAAIEELARVNEITLEAGQLALLRESSDGLPLFLRLLFSNWDHQADTPAGLAGDVRSLLGEAILPLLSAATIEALVGIALVAIVSPEVSDKELRRLPLADFDEALGILEAFSLIRRRVRGPAKFVKVHDLVRDAVIELCSDRVRQLANALAANAVHRGADNEAALFWLYAAPDGFASPVPATTIVDVIFRAVATKDYPLLTTFSVLATTRPEIKRLSLLDSRLTDSFLYASASVLAGRGAYADAGAVLNGSGLSVLRKAATDPERLTQLEFEIAYLQADLEHLQNQYDEAAASFGLLRGATRTRRFADKAARVEWAIGHVLRHQGRDLDAALAHFDAALVLATESGDIYTQVFSTTGKLGIHIYLNQIPTGAVEELDRLESMLSIHPEFRNYLPKIWKSRAQIESMRGNADEARSLIAKAIDQALAMNDRLLFNYYFERGEIQRCDGKYSDSIKDYLEVLEYGRENGDRNLIANALLGILEAELSNGTPTYHRSRTDMRASALQARAIAVDADILTIQTQAESTLSRLEGRHTVPGRLVLF